MDGCKSMHSLLKKDLGDIYVLTGKDDAYRGGTVIVPSYLAKGLEFDAVIIADASRDTYTEDDLDVKLLYVAMTRALHKLCIYHSGEPSPLLAGIDV
jgi:DNA helicase-2/ATP-dependent DNA helicase PcrA